MAVVQYSPFRSYDTGCPDKQLVMQSTAYEQMINFLTQSPVLVFDFETSGLAWFRHAEACGVALGGWDSQGPRYYYVPFRHNTGEPQLGIENIRLALQSLLADPRKLKIAHNLKFDMHFARKEGWQVVEPWYDTMIAARLYEENYSVKLKTRAEIDLKRLDADVWENRLKAEEAQQAKLNKMGVETYRDQYGYSQIPISICGPYACFDADFTLNLYLHYESGWRISDRYPRIWQTEMSLVEVICDMEEVGMPIDVSYLEHLRDSIRPYLADLEAAIFKMIGHAFNLGSDPDVRELLLDLGCNLHKKTQAGAWCVDREVLLEFDHVHPVIPMIQQWREAEKIRSTYTDSILGKLDAQGILHPSFNQMGTNTGRLSSSGPNFQNQPSDSDARAQKYSGRKLEEGGIDPWSVRRAFVNRGRGWMRLFFDYSQIELRVLAYYSKDPVMIDAFLQGEDIHDRTSLEVFGTKEKARRRWAKVINFGLSYCMTELGFSRQAKISHAQAVEFLARFFERYSGVRDFRYKFWKEAMSQGGYFVNLFGRPRHMNRLLSDKSYERRRAERQAIATLIQGTAAELTKESLVRIHQFLKQERLPAFLVSTVHDEIQIDCSIDALSVVAPRVKALMEFYPEFSPIPIIVDGDYSVTSWSDKKGLPLCTNH